MFEIREIKPDEYAFLREMLYEAIYIPDGEEKLPVSVVDEPHIAKYAKDFGREGDHAFILLTDKEPAGVIWTRMFTENDAAYGFVDERTPELSMAIREEFRGLGFGTRLIEKLCRELKDKSIEKVSLSVDKQNQAVSLYQRCGFEIVAEKGSAYTMLKKL